MEMDSRDLISLRPRDMIGQEYRTWLTSGLDVLSDILKNLPLLRRILIKSRRRPLSQFSKCQMLS